MKYMMTRTTQAEKGTLGLTVPNFVVKMKPWGEEAVDKEPMAEGHDE